MRALGFDVKKPAIVKMVHDVDPSNTGNVDYHQFLEISEQSYTYLIFHYLYLYLCADWPFYLIGISE
jgi:hypothetical protein